jgi:hypothetical protein
VARGVETILLFLPDLAQADFVLFPRVGLEMMGILLSQDLFKMSWEGPSKPSPKMSSLKLFDAGWTVVKSASASVELKQKNNLK